MSVNGSTGSGAGVEPDVSPDRVAVATELGAQTALLAALLAESRIDIFEVAVSNGSGREMVLEDFPVAGAKRVIVQRTGQGFDGLAVAAGLPATDVLTHNEGRLGGTIVNSGASPVILYLTGSTQSLTGRPAIWLSANGGSWDFRLGNMLWAGSVCAVAQVSASTLTVAEV